MYQLPSVLLQSEELLPIDVVGWVVLAVSLLVTIVWLAYVYR